jgi:hypothetical protein
MNSAHAIDPTQAGLWDSLAGRSLNRADVEPYGVEYLTDAERLREVRQLYPPPTIVDVGYGIIGAAVALLYVDHDSGRVVAYAPPYTVLRAALEDLASIAVDDSQKPPANSQRWQIRGREMALYIHRLAPFHDVDALGLLRGATEEGWVTEAQVNIARRTEACNDG